MVDKFSVPLALSLALAFLVPNVASAAPIVPAPKAQITADLVVPVHGCHRSCIRAYVPRWGVVARHRHVGPGCYPQACGRRYDSLPPGWGGRGCYKVGPVWYCP